MITRPKVSSIVPSQLPEFVRDEYQTFVDFLKAYYEFLESTQQDPISLRDLDTSLDSFITYFKAELATSLPYSTVDQRFLLGRIKDLYLAKGSEASFKLLFRILFNKNIEIDYPATQMLRASDGKWNQDVSVFVQILVGNVQDIVGKLVDVVTQTKIIRVLVDRRQYVEVEVDRAIRVSDTIYELILDRRFFGDISVGDNLRYVDPVTNTTIFNSVILPTTTSLKIENPGAGFKVGGIYNINNFNGKGSILKVSSVDSNGGIVLGQFIKYGTGYTTDFTTTISSYSGQDSSGTSGTTIDRVETFLAPANKTVTLTFRESLNGFEESGSFNTADLNQQSAAEIAADIATYGVAKGNFFDGSYAGIVLREFGITSHDSQVTSTAPAVIKVTLGPLAKYPGYYVNNDGFLDDAIYIQDSKYYQAFSYVIKIDQALESYRTVVKNLIHPSGTQVFGEYDIRNEFSIGTTLESLIKILSVSLYDSVKTDSGLDTNNLTRVMPYIDYSKSVDNTVLNNDGSVDDQTVTMVETGIALDSTRTMPYLVTTKPIDDTNNILNDGISLDNFYVTMAETAYYLLTTKVLDATHIINDGTTIDNETVLLQDGGDVQDLTRTNVAFTNTKLLDATHFLNDGTTLDPENVVPTEAGYVNADSTYRYGISDYQVTKTLDSTTVVHYLNDGTTADNDTVTPTDTNATSPTDLNRTTPAFVFTTTIDPSYYGGNDNAALVDSGGTLDVNPYGEAGYFLGDGGLYVGNPINFTG